jgi:hypothetical protein
MKLAIAAYLLATSSGIAKAQECGVTGMWKLEASGTCDYATILEAYEQQVYNAPGSSSCADGTKSAAEEFDGLLASTGQTVDDICKALYDNMEITPFYDAARKGEDYKFEEAFYNGHTKWQEEVETTYESADGSATSVLRVDAANVKAFYQGPGSYSQVSMPPIPNFEQCDANAAMCCWTKDRQAADNNGNCNRNTYSENCVDKDPADNTNACFVDLEKGSFATKFDSSDGLIELPGDGNQGEGAIHCHGYAWANDSGDPITRYKANNLFYVSMYDHMHQRGYVKNIPGAPMCGCVEKMPIVTRSDCTQVDLEEEYEVSFDGTSVTAVMTKVEVDFNACQGKNGRNNDLYAYSHKLYEQGKITNKQFGTVGRVLTNDNRCEFAREAELEKKGLKYGYIYNEKNWTQVAGVGGMDVGEEPYGHNAFKTAYEQSTHGIIHRGCADCTSPDHKHIYYRRLTPIPDDFDLLNHLLNGRSNADERNVWKVDFELYSTYEDAVNNVNPWQCPNDAFDYGNTFVGECSPSGQRVRNQQIRFKDVGGSPVRNVGFYVDKPEDAGIKDFLDGGAGERSALYRDEDLGHPMKKGSTTENDGTYHMLCGGSDIWGTKDEGHYKARLESGDIDVVVRVDSISPITDGWAKAGIMLRSSYDNDAVTAFALLSGENGVGFHTRVSKGNSMTMPGDKFDQDQTSSWVKLQKIGAHITFSYSDDGVVWTKRAEDTVFFPDDKFFVGLACTSHRSDKVTEATFSNYEVIRYEAPTASPTVSSAPTLWDANENIGEPLRDGEYWPADANGVEKIRGSGTGIWGTTDSFFYHAYQRPSNDFTVTTFISGFGSSQVFARGGIMIRDDSSDGASNAFIGAMGNYRGIGFQTRDSAGEETVHHNGHYVPSNKAWVKLIKTGNNIDALYRTESQEEWTSLGSKTVNFSGTTIQVGYAVTVGSDENQWWYADLYAKDYSIEEN